MQGWLNLPDSECINDHSHATMAAERASFTPEAEPERLQVGTPELRRVLRVKRKLGILSEGARAEKARIEAEKREAEVEVEMLRAAMEAAQSRLDARIKALEAIERGETDAQRRLQAELDAAVSSPLGDGE